MSAFSRLVYEFISANPGYRASQIIDGVRSHRPKTKRGYVNATIQSLKNCGFLSTTKHAASTTARTIFAYSVSAPYDEEIFAVWQRELRHAPKPHEEKQLVDTAQPAFRLRKVVKSKPTRAKTATMHTHTFMLRPGCLIKVELPEDLTEQEVQRIANFTKSLIFK